MKRCITLWFLLSISIPSYCQIDLDLDQIVSEIETSNSSIDLEPNITRKTEFINPPNSNNVVTNLNEKVFSLDPVPLNGTNGTSCEFACVPFYQCNNGSLVTTGENIFDIRVNDGPCGSALLTCCQPKDRTTDDRILSPSTTSSIPRGCGHRNPDGVGLTITGAKDNEAQFAEFPWMVSISRDLDNNQRPSCGGALIHPSAVITAAHCVAADKNQRWKVRAGEWDIIKTIEPIPHQEVLVESITIHKDFYSGALFNDIAFLYLTTPVKIGDNVNTICLPPQNYQHRPTRCFTTGWGKDKFGQKGQYHVILKKVDIPFVPRDICQENLRKTRLGRFFELHSSFMCAGGEIGKDACNGDGGSPLVCPLEKEKWRYYHAGIVAWGIGCGDRNVPGVYVDVAKFRDWIDEQMKLRNLETVSYDQNIGLEPRF